MYTKEGLIFVTIFAVILTFSVINGVRGAEDGLDGNHEHKIKRKDPKYNSDEHKEGDDEDGDDDKKYADPGEEQEVDEKEIEYQKGSVCGYCTYCKFCKLCDADCPCERSATKPNCHLCKYCRYCYLCTILCDTVCQPGGIVDRVTSSIFSGLPKYNKDEIDQDIGSAQDWIDKSKEEL